MTRSTRSTHSSKKSSATWRLAKAIGGSIEGFAETVVFEAINMVPGHGRTPSFNETIRKSKAKKGRK